jgi:hypothetical protein
MRLTIARSATAPIDGTRQAARLSTSVRERTDCPEAKHEHPRLA